VLHQLLQARQQRRAVAAAAGQRQLLAQAPVARREFGIGHGRRGAGGGCATGIAAVAQPVLQRLPFGLVAGDELLLPHRRPSNPLAMPYRRSTPAAPVAPVSGCNSPASSARRAGGSCGARSPKATIAACSSARSGCPGARAGTAGTCGAAAGGGTCTTRVSATRSPTRRPWRSHRLATRPVA